MDEVFLMKCCHHPKVEAIAACVKCREPICETCRVKINERNFCTECAEKPGFKVNNELIDLENFPRDVSKAAHRADDYLKDKGVYEEVGKLKTKSSELLKSFSKNISDDNTEGGRESAPVKMIAKNPLGEIKKAKELLDMGAINEEEFTEIKKKHLKQL
jgi:hypothetical protein